MFRDFVLENSSLFSAVVELPVIPNKRSSGTRNWGLVRRILRGTLWFPLLTGLAYTIYAPLARLCGRDLRSAAKLSGIRYSYQRHITPEFIDWLKAQAPDYILNGASTIISSSLLAVPKCGVLNYHGVTLPEFRGTGNQFWLLSEGVPSFRTALHYVDEGLDTGDIILQSEPILVPATTTVFAVWLQMLHGAKPLLEQARPWLESGICPRGTPQDNSMAVVRSFPTRQSVAELRRRGHRVIALGDIVRVLRTALTGRL